MMEYEQQLTAIARAHRMTLQEMRGPSRFARLVAARREAYALLRDRGWSYPRIGAYFHRDHTTIIYAMREQKTGRIHKTRLQQYAEQWDGAGI